MKKKTNPKQKGQTNEEAATKDVPKKSERRYSRRSLRIASQRAENVTQSDSFENKEFPAENSRASSPETARLDVNHYPDGSPSKPEPGENSAEIGKADVANPTVRVSLVATTPVPRRRKSARRSLSHSITATNKETAAGAEGLSQPETVGQLPGTPGEDLRTSQPRGRPSRSRKSMSVAEEFLLPSPGSTVKRSGKKRSKSTQRRDDKKVPKSPEEWIQLLESSPMIEMTRRKMKTPPGSHAVSMTIDFDDLDLLGPLPERRMMEEELSASDSFIQLTGSPCVTQTSAPSIHTSENPEENKEKSVSAEDTTQKTSVQMVPADGSSTPAQTLPVTKPNPSEGSGHDVKYFRGLMACETQRFNDLCAMWENINSSENQLTEEVTGQIRTTIGQAQLLMAQRFKQFSGLVDNCEFGTGEKETTCSDLQGFWDMIYYQVEDVHNKFEDLRKLKAANWVKVEDTQTTKIKPKPKKKVVTNPVKSKPAGKSKFAAFRAQMMKKKKEGENIEDKDKSDSKDDNMKVFDAGFFKVTSPKRSPRPHCAGGTPNKVAQTVPEETKTPSQREETKLPKPSAILYEPSLPVTPVINRTPRRSYVPVVPSPLLCDITPSSVRNKPSFRYTPKPLKRCAPSADPADDGDNNVSPMKRRRRSRANSRSVSVSDLPEPSTPYDSNNTPAQDVSEDRAENETGRQTKSALKKSRSSGTRKSARLSVHFDASTGLTNGDETEKQTKSTLKKSKTTGARKSARLSVHFDASTEDTGPSLNMPQTPVNRNSRVPVTRVRSAPKDTPEPPGDVSGKENLPVSKLPFKQDTSVSSSPLATNNKQ